MTNTLTAKFASAAIAVILTTTSFAEVTHAQTVEFAYDKSELQSAAGIARIETRIAKFARSVCNDVSTIVPAGVRKECREQVRQELSGKIWPLAKQEAVR